MQEIVQARLDPETAKILDELAGYLNKGRSEIVREAIRQLAMSTPVRKPSFVGLGQFDSGIPDLATNKKHMKGYGAKGLSGQR